MNYPIKLKNKETYLNQLFLLDQYKSISINTYFFNNKLGFLWILFTYLRLYNYLVSPNKQLLNKKLLYPTTTLHNIWYKSTGNRSYTLFFKKTYNVNYFSISSQINQRWSVKKLYITNCCYNINKSITLNSLTNKSSSNIYLYFIKVLQSNIIYIYTASLYYLRFFNSLCNLSLIKSLGFKSNNLIISTKSLTKHNLINHNLKNL